MKTQLKRELSRMQTPDKSVFQNRFSFRSFDVSIRIETNNSDLLAEFENLLPSESVLISNDLEPDFVFRVVWDEDEKRISEFYRNEEPQICEGNLEDSLHRLEISLRLTVAEFAGSLVFVHAGVVAFDEAAIVIPGNSFSGKTTLVKEFIAEGAVYYSDEYAVFDSAGFVHPYPKPLSVREKWANGKQIERTAESLGGRQGKTPLAVKAIIVTEFKKNARWQPRRLSLGEGVLELLAHTVSAQTNPHLALKILPQAAENALILKGKRGEARSFAKKFKEQLIKPLKMT